MSKIDEIHKELSKLKVDANKDGELPKHFTLQLLDLLERIVIEIKWMK